MDDLMKSHGRLNAELDESLSRLRKNGEEAARTNQEYYIAKRQAILRLKADGLPATLIQQMVKGEPEVADKLLARDIARTMYETNKEHINIRKIQLKNIEAQIEREWHG